MHNLFHTFSFKDKKALAFLAFLISLLQIALAVGLTLLTDQMAHLKVEGFALYLLVLFSICCLLALARWQTDRMKSRCMMKGKIQQQKLLLTALNRAPILDLEAKGEGGLLEILTGDVDTITNFLEIQSVEFFMGLSGCVLALLYGAFYSWKLLIFVLVFMSLSYFIDQKFPGWNQEHWDKRQDARDLLNQRVLDILQASKLLRIQGTKEFSERLYQDSFEKYNQADVKAEKSSFRQIAFGTAKSLIFDTAFLFFSLWLILQQQIQVGTFLGFSVIMQNIIWIFYYLPGMVANYGEFSASKARVDAYLTASEQIDSLYDLGELDNPLLLESRHVSFAYPENNKTVLHDFSLVMKRMPPDKTYLSGPSGSGKSTFLKLVLGFYSPDSGELILHAKRLAYVPQNTPIYSDTLRNNILLGRVADDDVLLELVRRVHLSSAVERLGGGLDLLLNQEMESNLSSGEIQKIGLARALFDTDFLVMDEPFANLDPQSEQDLSELLKELDIPILLTSHRTTFLSEAFKKVEIH